MKARAADEERRAELAELIGQGHEGLLDELIDLRVGAETIAALELVPLVAVAWADGKIQDAERTALFEAAETSGLKTGTVGWELFVGWLDTEPDARLFEAWKDYVGALRDSWTAAAVAALETQVVERAEHVARAAGGILGIGSVYGSESDVLKEIRAAFSGQ